MGKGNNHFSKIIIGVGTSEFRIEGLIFDTGQLDITVKVIGLKLLGTVIHYWDNLERQFVYNGVKRNLQGLHTLPMSPTSLPYGLSFIDKFLLMFVSMHNHQDIIAKGPVQNMEKVRAIMYKLDFSSFFKMHLLNFLRLKKAMRYFFAQILLSEPKLSASKWRIPIIFLVSCLIIHLWEQVDGWLTWWKGRPTEEATKEETSARTNQGRMLCIIRS
uniref:Uncharacterized protein n=1 Tax=Lactuca sativa TaxID=4236 RepID=A0A9R1VK90_LACSA|nr:hypothetical protein LSAT_V11C500242980 [Lactuca sativa]